MRGSRCSNCATRSRAIFQRDSSSRATRRFGTLKYRTFGHPRLLPRSLSGTITEIGISVMTYNNAHNFPFLVLPAGGDGRRVTARSKGKVERPFRTVKEMHETLYHFHEPSTEEEANAWLMNFLLRYNSMQHRSEPHTRIEDWVENPPPSGIRAMCRWERFRTFAREADRRKVGIDARVSAEGCGASRRLWLRARRFWSRSRSRSTKASSACPC